MIATNSAGMALSSGFRRRLRSKVLNESNGPVDQIIFARKLPSLLTPNQDIWFTRDVTKMFFNSEPITKSIADN